MKRIYSFIVMCFTALILVVANMPSIKNDKQLSGQFTKGTELVYKIESWEEGKEVSQAQIDKTVKVLNERIDASGLGYYEVSYIGNDYIRVLCPETKYSDLKEIKELISKNVVVTVGVNNLNGKYVDVFDDVHDVFHLEDDDDIVFSYTSTYQYELVFELKDAAYDKLKDYDSTMVTVYKEYYDEEKKDLEENKTQYTFNVDGKKVTFASYDVQALSDQLYDMRYGNYPVSIEYYSAIDIAPTAVNSSNSFLYLVIATLIAIAAICFILIKKYKYSGILASILIGCSVVFSALAFNFLNGEYDTLTCIAYIMGVVVGIDLFISVTQKVRNELYKGKRAARAFNEGFSKSIMMIFDVTVVYIIMILVMYFAGNIMVKNVALMLMSTMVSNILFMVFGYYLVGSFMIPSSKLVNKNLFNIQEDKVANIAKGEVSRHEEIRVIKARASISKKFLPIALVVMLIGGALFTTLSLVNGRGFNYTEEVSSSYVLRIAAPLSDEIDSQSDILSLLKENNISLPYDRKEYGVSVNTADFDAGEAEYIDTYGVLTFYSKDDKILDYAERVAEVVEMRVGEAYEDHMVYAGELTVTGVEETAMNVLKVFAIIMLAVFVYVIFRFRLSMVLGIIVSAIISSLSFLSLVAIVRIPFNYITIMVTLLLFVASILYSTSLFEKAKELTRLNKKYEILNEEQSEQIATGLTNSIAYRFQYSVLAFAVMIVVSLLVVRGNMFFNYIAYLLGIVIVIVSTLFVALPIWRKTDSKVKPLSLKSKLRREKKKAKQKKVDDGPQEYTFTGIND